MAEHIHTTSAPTTRKTREPATNVIALRAPAETVDAILKDVAERSRVENEHLRSLMQSVGAKLTERHRARAQECVGIGVAMDRPTLDNWIEIGERMLGGRTRA